VVVDKQKQYRAHVNVMERQASESYELLGHHEILLPLLHVAVACKLAGVNRQPSLHEAAA